MPRSGPGRKHWRPSGACDLPSPGRTRIRGTMPIQFKTSGCLASIVLSIGLTILLNLLVRSC